MGLSLTRQAVHAAYGWGRAQDWPGALALLGEAAAAGEPDAARQLALVTQDDLTRLLTPPEPQWQAGPSRIAIGRGFAPPGFADWLIDRAKDRLDEATVEEEVAGQTLRTARTFFFPPRECDLVLAILQHRAAALTGIAPQFHEPPSVISYEVGQEFRPHVDFIDPDIAAYRSELDRSGQRTATFVTYLNDDFDGAETVFPELALTFRGSPGDAIFFANVLPDDTPDRNTIHAALPPTRGRKWVLSQWIRNKPFLYAREALD